ncbi:FG-GAP repeat domain-containing protein [Paenarthrobacter sp. NPDC089714]|uniref:FG-GAP repeat domain-containing protein n=1 Tax=Paenarthrobacter sp. NPDC089714 TaxID=3364377 RepID=UPI003800089A
MGIFGVRKAIYAATAMVAGASFVAMAPPAVANPAVANPAVTTPAVGPTAIIDGVPYVGAELRKQYDYDYSGCKNPTGTTPNGYTLEWLQDGVALPPERQGEVLKLVPADLGHRISLKVRPSTPAEPNCPDETRVSPDSAPVKASSRAMGWTDRGNFEPLGRTQDGRLILYPRTYTYIPGSCEGACPTYFGEWDESRQVGQGWDAMGIVFSPGDFDGDGYNDLLATDATGTLFLYPGDGDGGWQERQQVGQGWNIFDSIVGPGDFDGDGFNDVLARDAAGDLYLYPGDGDGGWLPRSKVGQGWQVMDKIITGGDMNGDGPVEVFARDRDGYISIYRADGTGGWESSAVVSGGWGTFTDIKGLGSFGHQRYNNLFAVNGNGDLVTYSTGASTGVLWGPYGPVGTGWNVFRELL